MSRQTLIALGGGGLSAIVATAIVTGLAPLPLFLVGLSLGVGAGSVAVAAGVVAAGLIEGVVTAAFYGLVYALPALLVISRALAVRPTPDGGTAWYPGGFILCWLAALGSGLVVAESVVNWGSGGDIAAAVEIYLDQVFAILLPSLAEADRSAPHRRCDPRRARRGGRHLGRDDDGQPDSGASGLGACGTQPETESQAGGP